MIMKEDNIPKSKLIALKKNDTELTQKINASILDLDLHSCYFSDIIQISIRNFKNKVELF